MHHRALTPFVCSLFIASAISLLSGCERRSDDVATISNREAGKRDIYDLEGTIVPGEAQDEAKSGKTSRGTPVRRRTEYCFPAESRDLLWQMDMVASGDKGELKPLNFDENGDNKVDVGERDAIRGRNTWLLWGAGNEAFWGWLQERGYGLTDFLILMDSRKRGDRFKTAGLINQPGFESSTQPILGLYLDRPKNGDWKSAMLRPPPNRDEAGNPISSDYEGAYDQAEPERYDAQGRKLAEPVYRPKLSAEEASREDCRKCHDPRQPKLELFEPWTTAAERARQWAKEGKQIDDPFKDYVPEVLRKKLPQDGLDTSIYGYPSGIFGLRLFLNPDFFGKTKDAARARSYWKERVEGSGGYYYTETRIHSDPKLVRPFRVAMSCGFCHVAQHPLNPPVRDDEPEWENLSSIIGAQYWDPQSAFGNLLKEGNFLHHFLKSQAPGTIDTSLVSSDHINNTNVINPIFDVPARLARAGGVVRLPDVGEKPTELQSRENLLLPSIEDPETSNNPDGENKQRHFPMVLGPGEDSVGVFGALARVPLNIGVFSEEWMRTGNLVLGYTPQRPFRIAVNRANSVYWNVNEKYRVPYMAAFFDLGHKLKVAKSTAAMKLKDAQEVVRDPQGNAVFDANGRPVREPAGRKVLDEDIKDKPGLRDKGRKVFLDNCAICHSSKLPEGFDLRFTREIPAGGWDKAPAPPDGNPLIYTLPMEYSHWEEFRSSPALADFRKRIYKVAGDAPKAGEKDKFIENNFLSNELRIPITLTGTYAGRALATNAMQGHVWDNYSSDDFKKLPSVGKIRFFNPYRQNPSAVKLDPFGTNDEFEDGRKFGGPGYFRPATLISIWATAPFFHNNALGIYPQDTSVKGRLIAFDDAIRKLLWNEQRPRYERQGVTYVPPGDLRPKKSAAAANDPGYIYRLPVDTHVLFQPGFIRPIIEGLLIGYTGIAVGKFLFTVLSFWWWAVLTVVFLILIFKGRARHAGIFLLLLALALAAVLALTGMGGYGGTVVGTLMMGATNMLEYASGCLWLVVLALAILGLLLLFTRREWRFLARLLFVVATVVTLFVGILANKFLTGHLKQVHPLLAVLPNCWLNADYKGIDVGPIAKGTPVNLIMSLDPTKTDKVGPALVALVRASAQIKKQHLTDEAAYKVIAEQAGPALIAASKCPDFVLDRGHWFGEFLTNDEKEALIAFLKTL
jgi:hypothetical protein